MKTVIEIKNLSKIYSLGEIGTGTISRDIERWYRTKILRQEDPFLKIGENNERNKRGSSNIVYSLRDINFKVQQGEALGIIGKNGAGKSTLLKIISRVTSPTTGKIRIKGRVASLLEVGTGFHPELTGRENIFLNGAILGMRKNEITHKLDEIIDFSGVERYIDTPVKRYSSGMYVRLAFAVAAHLESEIMIVDEVLAVGDAEFQKKCLGKMGNVAHDGRTIFFVSHNLTAINSLCNRVILLSDGRIESEGVAHDVIDKYLGYSTANQYFLEWKRPPELKMQFSEIVDIKGYRIVDSSGAVAEKSLFRSGNYNVMIDVVIKKWNPNLVFFVSYYTSDETLLFISDINDDPANNIVLTPGEKTFMTRVPVEILNSGSYRIELSCVIHYAGWPLIGGRGQMLEFKFHNNKDNNRMNYASTHPFSGSLKPGIISPVLPWSEIK